MNLHHHLPYDTSKQGVSWLNEIKQGLCNSISVGSYSPGASNWIKQLYSFLELKYTLSLQDRIHLIKLLYHTIFVHSLDSHLVEYFSQITIKLLKEKKSQVIPIEELTLDWRPLNELLLKLWLPKNRERLRSSTARHLSSLVKLMGLANRYFDENATFDILELVLPNVNVNDSASTIKYLVFLTNILPTEGLPKGLSIDSVSHSLSKSMSHNVSHGFYWIPSLFNIWLLMMNLSTIDYFYLGLFSRLSENNIHRPQVVGYTVQQIKWIMSVGLRSMEIPVGSTSDISQQNTSFGSDLSLLTETFGSVSIGKIERFAKFIIYNIYPMEAPNAPPYNILHSLETLLQAIESFFHPSNSGRWTSLICKFINILSREFLKRIRQETQGTSKTPMEFQITREMKLKFVELIRPLAFMAMFGKDAGATMTIHDTLKHLAWIEPNSIFPGLLERIYSSLESVTESHRTISSIRALIAVNRALITRDHYPEGGQHLVALLNLLLPAIDMNDPSKSSACLFFISLMSRHVPLMDSSTLVSHGQVESEADEYTRLSTVGFESWVMSFISRLLILFENLPEQHEKQENTRQTAEKSLMDMVRFATETVFSQVSCSITDQAIAKMSRFIQQNIIPNATKTIAFLCGSLGGSDSNKRLAAFFPICRDKIISELEAGASSTSSASHLSANTNPLGFAHMSDAPFHYYQSILNHCIMYSGEHLLLYKSDLICILESTLEKSNSRVGYKWSVKLLSNVFVSLLSVYPREQLSHSPSLWNDPNQDSNHKEIPHELWGKCTNMNELNIEWHTPSKLEIDFCIELLSRFIPIVLNKIHETLEHPGDSLSHYLSRWLAWTKSLLQGLSLLMKPMNQPLLSLVEDTYVDPYQKTNFNCGYPISMEENPQLYQELLSLRHQIGQAFILIGSSFKNGLSEDSVEAVKALVTNLHFYMSFTGIDSTKLSTFASNYKFMKASLKMIEDGKTLPRTLLIKRVYLIHMTHAKTNSVLYEPIFDDMMDLLMSFCINKYAQIRRTASSTLSKCFKLFSHYKIVYFPRLLHVLNSTPCDTPHFDDIIQGVIQTLRGDSLLGLCMRHWEFSRPLLTSILSNKSIEKPETMEYLRKLFLEFLLTFSPLDMMECQVDERCLELSRALAPFSSSSKNSNNSHQSQVDNQVQVTRLIKAKNKRLEACKTHYKGLIQDLIRILSSPQLHWRFRAMGLSLIEAILSKQELIPLELTQLVIQTMNSEHPSLRRVSLTLITRILIVMKERSGRIGVLKKTIPLNFKNVEECRDFTRSLIVDLHNNNTMATKVDPFLLDSCNIGWLCWPRSLSVYPCSMDCSMDQSISMNEDVSINDSQIDSDDTSSLVAIQQMYSNESFWKAFLEFTSQEKSNETEGFNHSCMYFYKRLFSTFGDSILSFLFPMLERFIQDTSDKGKQRAATEVLAGVIRGSKHWNTSSLAKVWDSVLALLSKGFSQATSESLVYWKGCIKHMMGKLDPHRSTRLLHMIFSNKFDFHSQSFFTEAKKILFALELLSIFSWRFRPSSLLYEYLNQIASPYQQIRDALGKSINQLTVGEWHPSLPSVEYLLQHPESLVPQRQDSVYSIYNHVLSDLIQSRSAASLDSMVEHKSLYSNACKTLLSVVYDLTMSYKVITLGYMELFLDEIFKMQDCSDLDLQMMSKVITQSLLPQYPHPPTLVPPILERILSMLKEQNESWHSKMRILPTIQIFYFRNLFLIDKSSQGLLLESIVDLLGYSKIEVRKLASVTLSGLVRCSQRDVVSHLKSVAEADLKELKLPRSRNSLDSNVYHDLIRKKHAAVLCLSSLILAFPYEIPSWMPESLILLSLCSSDPNPIGSEVAKTFTEFRRTHQDTWHEDKLKFTEDQLYDLSDLLISPSYYV